MGGLAQYALPIIGGYLLAYHSYWFKYRLARSAGYRFYFHVVHLAVVLSASAIGVLLVIDSIPAVYRAATEEAVSLKFRFSDFSQLESWVRERQSEIFILSFLLGPAAAVLLNILPTTNRYGSLQHAIKDRDFDLLVRKSTEEEKPVLYTLSTKHVYLGFNVRGPDPEAQLRWIRILPLASGYRDSETQELQFTTFYGKILSEIWASSAEARNNPEAEVAFPNTTLEDFEVVLSTDEIHSAHLFDVRVYEHFDPDQASKL